MELSILSCQAPMSFPDMILLLTHLDLDIILGYPVLVCTAMQLMTPYSLFGARPKQ